MPISQEKTLHWLFVIQSTWESTWGRLVIRSWFFTAAFVTWWAVPLLCWQTFHHDSYCPSCLTGFLQPSEGRCWLDHPGLSVTYLTFDLVFLGSWGVTVCQQSGHWPEPFPCLWIVANAYGCVSTSVGWWLSLRRIKSFALQWWPCSKSVFFHLRKFTFPRENSSHYTFVCQIGKTTANFNPETTSQVSTLRHTQENRIGSGFTWTWIPPS